VGSGLAPVLCPRRSSDNQFVPHRIDTFLWFCKAMIAIVGTSGTLLGSLFLTGVDWRYSGPAFYTARSIPGGMHTWGAVFMIVGLIVLAGIIHGWHPKTLAVSLWALATVYLFFSMAIWLEVGNLLVPLTGGVTYLELAVLSLICGAVARRLT
jgi:hypothetical protein